MPNFDKDISHYRKLVERDPHDCHAWNELGVACIKNNLREEALAAFFRAIEVDDNYVFARLNAAMALMRLRRFVEACTHLNHVLEKAPSNPLAWNRLGQVHYERAVAMGTRTDLALTCFLKAIELAPDYATAHANLGLLFHHDGWIEHAVQAWETATRLNPYSARIRKSLEMARREIGGPPV